VYKRLIQNFLFVLWLFKVAEALQVGCDHCQAVARVTVKVNQALGLKDMGYEGLITD